MRSREKHNCGRLEGYCKSRGEHAASVQCLFAMQTLCEPMGEALFSSRSLIASGAHTKRTESAMAAPTTKTGRGDSLWV